MSRDPIKTDMRYLTINTLLNTMKKLPSLLGDDASHRALRINVVQMVHDNVRRVVGFDSANYYLGVKMGHTTNTFCYRCVFHKGFFAC